MAATGFRPLGVPRAYAIAWPAYGAGVLALVTHVGLGGERALGVLTWLVLLCALWPLPALARAQALGVVAFATIGEVAGSIVWGVYHYRLHDLPLFVPPGHGLVYLTGLAVARIVGESRVRRRVFRRGSPRAVRHLDRRLALGEDTAGPRHHRRQPAQRRGERLCGLRRDRDARRANARPRGSQAQAEASDPARTRG